MSEKQISLTSSSGAEGFGKTAAEGQEITVGVFIELLTGNSDSLNEGRLQGWLEEADELNEQEPLLRKDAARILHMYRKKVLEKPDLPQWIHAGELRDIYDCRVCTEHIAQIYDLGIMEAIEITELQNSNGRRFLIFDSRRQVTEKEAKAYIQRLFQE